MAGQVAYHLLAQAGAARAPWAITTIVSCLPVLVLAMGTTLAHMLRADAITEDAPDSETGGPESPRSPDRSAGGQGRPRPDQARDGGAPAVSGPGVGTRMPRRRDPDVAVKTNAPDHRTAQPETEQGLIASGLAAAGKPVSRRTLRSSGVRGSNESLNALARKVNAELAGAAPPSAQP
jgi:hypothetical protein